MPRLVTRDVDEAQAFFDDAVARGHEGVVVKAVEAPYEAGRRGGTWLKVKPVHTWTWWCSPPNGDTAGARAGCPTCTSEPATRPATAYVMLGKTFKGLTDELLAWQTERFLELETSRDSSTVYVRPELVVEIAFDGIQTSPRYPGGMALRFARVIRYREDKPADEADTIDTVRMLSRRPVT